MKVVDGIALLNELLQQTIRVSGMLHQAASEGREHLLPEEKAAIRAAADDARARVEAKLGG